MRAPKDGKIIDPGVYSGYPMTLYHEQHCPGPSISSSGLRAIFTQSPAHYWAYSTLNRERVERPETDALLLGRAAHHLLLGEDDFSTLFVARPDRFDSWRTNAAKEWKAEQEAEGRVVLLPSQIETIRGMAKSLAAHPLIQHGILNGEIEQSFFWQDPETRVWLKARPDAIPNFSGDYADLKTTVSVRTEAIERTIAEYAYPMQAALIGMGSDLLLNRPMTSFSLVLVEKTPPYCVRVVTMKDADIERGRKQIQVALRVFAKCLKTGEWPGPGSADAEYVGIPPWEATRIENTLTLMEQELA